MSTIAIRFEATPNPNTLKFIAPSRLTDTPEEISSSQAAARSPLARKLFGFPWCEKVYIGLDFIAVTKQNWVDWDILAEPLAGLIGEHLERGEPVLHRAPGTGSPGASGSVTSGSTTSGSTASGRGTNGLETADSPVVQRIKKILDEEIRPAVALDGGDIVFHSYENNVLFVHMHGACSGCPSSTLTLKQGIQTRLQNEIPEIQDVVAMS